MGKKRSVGIMVVGLVYLLIGIVGSYMTYGLILMKNPNILHPLTSLFLAIAFISCAFLGLGILMLKEWARKLTVIWNWIIVIYLIVVSSIRLLQYSKVQEFSKSYTEPLHNVLHNFFILFLMFFLPITAFLLFNYVLTHPKVKALFSPERCEYEPKEAV